MFVSRGFGALKYGVYILGCIQKEIVISELRKERGWRLNMDGDINTPLATQINVAQAYIAKSHITPELFALIDEEHGLLKFISDHWYYLQGLNTQEILTILDNHIAGNQIDIQSLGIKEAQRLLIQWLVEYISDDEKIPQHIALRNLLKSKTYQEILSDTKLYQSGLENIIKKYKSETIRRENDGE